MSSKDNYTAIARITTLLVVCALLMISLLKPAYILNSRAKGVQLQTIKDIEVGYAIFISDQQ